MIVIDGPQGTPEWFEAKRARPSASNFNKICTTTGAPSKQRQSYLYELAGQAVSGQVAESYTTTAMLEGTRREAESRALFELLHDVEVRQVAVVYPDEEKKYVCSPDGLFNNDTCGLELKNPLAKTMVGYLLDGKLPTEYILQVQGSLLVTGLDVWQFMAYCPNMPVLDIEVHRDEKLISRLKEELEKFVFDLASTIRKLKKMGD